MAEKKVSIVYTLKDKASKGLKTLFNSVKTLRKSLFSLNGIITGITFGAITTAALKAAKLFGVQEEAVHSLNTALKNNGLYTKEVSENLQLYASSLQKVTTFGDEQLIQAESLFAQFGFNEEAIKKLTKATTDLAVAKKIDLRQAADLLAKSVGSSTNALSRYGIIINGLPKSSERLGSAVKQIAKLFGGQATTQAKTFNGSLQQMKNAVGDVVEIIGEQLAPTILAISNRIKFFAESIQEKNFKNLKTIFHGINDSIKPIEKTLTAITKTVFKSINGLFILKNAFKEATEAINNKFKNIFTGSVEDRVLKQQEKLLKKLEKLKNEKSNKLNNQVNTNIDSNSETTKTFDEKLSEKKNKFDIEFNFETTNKEKMLLQQKEFLKQEIKNQILTNKQKKTLEKQLNIFKKKSLEENYLNHKKKADSLIELTDEIANFEIRSSEDVARASVHILKKSLNTQINSIIKVGIVRAIGKGNYPLVGAIIAAGAAAKIAINSMKFKDGGIVPGSKFHGDKILGRLNSGEMILNRTQQSNLFNLLKNSVFAQKNDNSFLYNEYEQFENEKIQKKEIVILTDEGKELAKGISYIQNEMKRNGEIV